MAESLKIRAATIAHDGEVYDLVQGPLPDDLPSAVVEQLREADALAGPGDDVVVTAPGAPDPGAPATGGAVGAPAPSTSGGDALPDDAPSAADASVAELAAFIDSNNLNAKQTVALAGGTSDGAAKVLEAERTASGGDGRKTVIEPLESLTTS